MIAEKYLAVVGLSEEDTAHLRLLLRMVAGQLKQRWRWGTEEQADLIIIDPAELAGQIARNRAFSGGRRCAVFSETEPLRDGEARLDKPPKADNFAAVLNGSAATGMALDAPVMQQTDDFYDPDSFGADFLLDDDAAGHARAPHRDTNPAPGLDELLKPDEAALKPQFAVPTQLTGATFEGTAGPSKRSEKRIADTVDGLRKATPSEGINLSAMGVPVRRGMSEDATKYTLRHYLRGNLLGGPATCALDGAPALTLDPKEKAFHSAGTLAALAPYCNAELPRSAWKQVTTAELAQLRDVQPARAYAHLIWLDALMQANGRLAAHLDPGGRYRLRSWPDVVSHDFPHHHAIATALREPRKLNEIAAASGAPMADVFALVSAFDAIGLIDAERRAPRHEPAPASGGLFARLRKPFGKR